MRSAREAVDLGIGLVPEDRKRKGLVLGLGARDNVSLSLLRKLNFFGFSQKWKENSIFEEYKDRLKIKVSGPTAAVGTLSGGNQQKVVLAKWLATNPKFIILDEPTRGIDVGAKAEVHGIIARLASSGMAILLISSEMPEIIGVSHRIITMYQGVLKGEFDADDVTESDLVQSVMGLSEATTPREGRGQ
jgi:ribose transport system ATP-binding protein